MPKFELQCSPETRLRATRDAVKQLRITRDLLRAAGCGNAADYVQRAIKSTEGAERHALRLVGEAQRREDIPDYLRPLL